MANKKLVFECGLGSNLLTIVDTDSRVHIMLVRQAIEDIKKLSESELM